MSMSSFLVDVLGWIGGIALILAYGLVSQKKIDPQSMSYHLLNIFGALLLIINTYFYGAYPSTAVSVVWVIVGIYYVVKIMRMDKQ